MGNCRDCIHWDKDGTSSVGVLVAAASHRRCMSPKMLDAADLDWWAKMSGGTVPNDAAIYPESEGRLARLSSGPAFGCIHFRARE